MIKNKNENIMLAAFLLIALVLFWPFLHEQFRIISDPYIFSDDARTNFTFYRYYDPTLFKADFIGDYLYNIFATPAWRLIYHIGNALHIDLQVMSKISSLVLWAAMLLVIGATFWELTKNRAVVAGGLVFVISCDIFLYMLTGGFARSYGFPLLALALLAFLKNRPLWLGMVTLLSAASYPPIAVMSGFLMAALLLFSSFFKLETNGGQWNIYKKLGVLGATALIAGLIVLPQALHSKDYGRRVDNLKDGSQFPEAAIGGRNSRANLPPYENFMVGVFKNSFNLLAKRDVQNFPFYKLESLKLAKARKLMASIILLVIITLSIRNIKNQPKKYLRSKAVIFIGVAATAHMLSALAAPYFYEPERFVSYPIPLLLAVFIPVWLFNILQENSERFVPEINVGAKFLGIIVIYIIAMGGPSPTIGSTVFISEADKPLYEYIGNLPTGAMIAGWPHWDEPACNIPLISKKPILTCMEFHYTFNMDYMKAMGVKTDELMQAYFSDDANRLKDLKEKYHLSYFIASKAHFFNGVRPGYFKPFDKKIDALIAENKQPALKKLYDSPAKIFETDNYYIIDLSKI